MPKGEARLVKAAAMTRRAMAAPNCIQASDCGSTASMPRIAPGKEGLEGKMEPTGTVTGKGPYVLSPKASVISRLTKSWGAFVVFSPIEVTSKEYVQYPHVPVSLAVETA